jgi:hypothetical protein
VPAEAADTPVQHTDQDPDSPTAIDDKYRLGRNCFLRPLVCFPYGNLWQWCVVG